MKAHPNEEIVLHGFEAGLSVRALPDGRYGFVVRDGKGAEAVYGPLVAADLRNAGSRLKAGMVMPVYAPPAPPPRKRVDWYGDLNAFVKGLLNESISGPAMAALLIDTPRWATLPQGSNYWPDIYYKLKNGALLAKQHRDELVEVVLDKIGETP